MKKSLVLGGGFAGSALLIAAVAIASPASMGKADADGDGALNKAEVAAIVDGRFAKMDVNKDGQIDSADRAARKKAHFDEMDADKNGSISQAEFASPRAKRDGERGRDHGRRGHGGRHGMAMMKLADANGDKAITKAEMSATVGSLFDKADADKDGKISKEERMAARKLLSEQVRAAAVE